MSELSRVAFRQRAVISAMQGLLANPIKKNGDPDEVAVDAVTYADALLEAMTESEAIDDPKD